MTNKDTRSTVFGINFFTLLCVAAVRMDSSQMHWNGDVNEYSHRNPNMGVE